MPNVHAAHINSVTTKRSAKDRVSIGKRRALRKLIVPTSGALPAMRALSTAVTPFSPRMMDALCLTLTGRRAADAP